MFDAWWCRKGMGSQHDFCLKQGRLLLLSGESFTVQAVEPVIGRQVVVPANAVYVWLVRLANHDLA